jgi:hypothetical protein
MLQAGPAGLKGAQGAISVVKVHSALPKDLPNSRLIAPSRDLRDALVSYRRFTGADFDEALATAMGWADLCDHYAAMGPEICLRPHYADIVAEPGRILAEIADFLALTVDRETRDCLLEKLDKESVARRIEAAEGRL